MLITTRGTGGDKDTSIEDSHPQDVCVRNGKGNDPRENEKIKMESNTMEDKAARRRKPGDDALWGMRMGGEGERRRVVRCLKGREREKKKHISVKCTIVCPSPY